MGEKVRLKVSARVRESSKCCDWSSPTGTMVDLIGQQGRSEKRNTHLYKRTSAACRTGYASKPSRRSASDTSSSELAFFDTASRAFQVVIRRKSPTGARVLRYHASSACSGICWCQLAHNTDRINSRLPGSTDKSALDRPRKLTMMRAYFAYPVAAEQDPEGA